MHPGGLGVLSLPALPRQNISFNLQLIGLGVQPIGKLPEIECPPECAASSPARDIDVALEE